MLTGETHVGTRPFWNGAHGAVGRESSFRWQPRPVNDRALLLSQPRRASSLLGVSTYSQLVPHAASPEERDAMLDDLAGIYHDLKETGAEPVAELRPQPDGDLWVISWEDDEVPAAA
jgi:hypothetical protein